MHENTFLTTPDVKTYLLKGHYSCGLEVFEIASKHVFNHARQSKISFLKKFLVAWKYAQKHQNTFLTTPNVQKYLFLKKSFWWSGSMCKCIKTRF
jgi:hypothetical protein